MNLSPDVLASFAEILPFMTWTAKAVCALMQRSQEVEQMTGLDQEAARAELDRTVNELAVIVQANVRAAVEGVIMRNAFKDFPEVLAFVKEFGVEDEKGFRDFSTRIFKIALDDLKIFKSQRELSGLAGVNPGQFSSFIRTGGPIGKDKIVACLDLVLKKAEETGSLDFLKGRLRALSSSL